MILVDTSALYARLDRSDRRHGGAIGAAFALDRDLARQGFRTIP